MPLLKAILMLLVFLRSTILLSEYGQKSMLFYTQSEVISSAVSDFYAEVEDLLRNKYHVIKEREVQDSYEHHANWQFVDRAIFLNAHPYADLDDKNKTHVKLNKQLDRMIIPVQQSLENNAVETAILVDCRPENFDSVSSCGLYMYSRKKRKITASTSRVFTVTVSTPKSWAPVMVENFVRGLSSIQEKKNKNIIKKLSLDEKDDHAFIRQIWFQTSGLIGATSIANHTMPGVSLALELGSANVKFAMDVSYFYKDKKINNISTLLRDYQFDLGVLLSSDKIRSLIWEMAFKVGYDYNKRQSSLETASSSNLIVSLQCGLKIPLGRTNAVSFRAAYGWPAVIKQTDFQTDGSDSAVVKYLSLGYVVQI